MSKTKADNAAVLRAVAQRKAERKASARSAKATAIGLLVGHDELEAWGQQRKAAKKRKPAKKNSYIIMAEHSYGG